MRALVAAVLLALTVLAGCASPEPTPDELELVDGTTVDLGDGVSATQGAIAGYVVDEAVRPLSDVRLSLAGGQRATTDDKGFFHFTLLDPGFYAVTATADGFLASQGSADVVAGETATVKLQLMRDAAPQPYHETFPFEAYMTAWGTVAQWAVEIVAPTPLCQCTYGFTPTGNVSSIVLEAFWEGTVPDPAALSQFYYEVYDDSVGWIESGYCSSPCHVRPSLDGFPQGAPINVRISGPDAWVAYQQQVHLFTTVFYNGPAPEDFTVAEPA